MKSYFSSNLLIASILYIGLCFFTPSSLFAQPANDLLCNAAALTIGASCNGIPNGNNTGATFEVGEPIASCYVGGTNSIWFSFVAPASGAVSITTDFAIGTNDDTEIALYDLPGGNCNMPSSLVELACNQDISFTNFLSFIPATVVTPGQTYYVSVSGWNSTEGTFCIQVNNAMPPANDSLCNATPLTLGATCNGMTNGDNTNSTSEAGEPLGTCFVGGPNSVWYSFVGPPSGLVNITTDNGVGTNSDTEIALYDLVGGNCATPANLVELDCNQDGGSGNFLSTIVATAVTPGQTYYIQVSGWNGTEGSFCLTAEEVVPPANDSLCGAVALTVGASCAGTPNGDNSAASFQSGEPMASCAGGLNTVWYSFVAPPSGFVNISTDTIGVSGTNAFTNFGLFALPGADCSMLGDLFETNCAPNNGLSGAMLDSVAVVPGTTYYIQVSGGIGTFCIEVEGVTPSFVLPANDSLCNATQLIVGASCNPMMPNGNNTSATFEINEPIGSCFSGGANSVWYSFVAPATGFVDITTDLFVDPSFTINDDTEIALYELPGGNCGDLTDLVEIACNQDINASIFTSSINIVPVTPGATYYIQVSGWNGTEGAFCIEVDAATTLANDDACGAILLPVDGTTITSGSNLGASVQANELLLQPNANNGEGYDGWNDPVIEASVWYKIVAPASGSVFIDLCNDGNGGTDFDTQVALYSATACNDLTTFAIEGANDDLLDCQSLFASYLEVTCLVPGDTLYVLVDGWGGETGNFGIRVGEISNSLSLGSALLDPSCAGNNDGIISVVGNGGGGNYEFIWNDGDTLAVRNDLSIGIYTVTMTDGCDSMITESFILAGNPSLEADAGNDTTICEGESVTLGGEPVGLNGLPFLSEQAVGVDLSNQSFVRFRLNTATTQNGVGAGNGFTIVAGDIVAGTFYGLDNDNDQLVTYNTVTGVIENVAPSDPLFNHTWAGLAYDVSASTMYAISLTQDPNNGVFSTQLYTIDLTTGTATPVAILDVTAVSALAIDNNGNMYGIDVLGNQLLSIDNATGVTTAIGATGYETDLFQDADFDPETNRLYIAASTLGAPAGTAPILRYANVLTGATLPIDTISGTELGAFAIGENEETPYTYTWTPSIGLSDSSVANPVLTPTASVTYTVSVRDNCQEVATSMVTISVSPTIMTAPSSTPDNGTSNGTATANASSGLAPYTYSWSNGDNSEVATGLDSGTYFVTVTDSLGCTTTDSVEVGSNVNIDALLEAGISSIQLFPNPSNGMINLSIKLIRPETINLEIFDMKGQKMMVLPEFSGQNYENSIRLDNLSAGVYMLKVSTLEGQAYKRIILNK